MATPSGTISFSQIQSELGGSNPISLSEYYKGTTIIPTNVGGAATIPASGTIDASDLRSKPVTLSYTQGTSPLVTTTGNPSNNPSLNLSNYLTSKEKQAGQTFIIVTLPNSGSFWAYPSNFVTTFTYGTAATFTSPRTGNKSTFRRIKYDGVNTIDFYCYYSGSDTNYKESGCYLKELRYE